MKTYKKVTGTSMSMPAGIALGFGVSMGITVIGAMVLAWLVLSERLAETAIGYGSIVILLSASAVGAMISTCVVKRRGLMVCGISTAAYYLGLLVIALLFGGQFEGMGVTAVFVLIGGGIAVLLALMGNKSGVKSRKIPRYR